MISIISTAAPATPYVQFIGLTLDGQGMALDGFFCRGNSSVRFYGNVISNTGGARPWAANCAYVTPHHNNIPPHRHIPAGAPPNIAPHYTSDQRRSYNINHC